MSTETQNEALEGLDDSMFAEQAEALGGKEEPVEATETESEAVSTPEASTTLDDVEEAFADMEDDSEAPSEDAKAEESNEPEEKAPKEDSNEAKDEFDIDELLSKFDSKQKELEVEKKRRADTQSDRQLQINKNNKMIEKLIEDGRLSPEEAQEYRTKTDDGTDVLNRIQKRFEKDKEILGSVFEEGDLDSAVDAFSILGLMDPEIREELMDLPEHKTSAYIVRKGKELQPLAEKISESGGSLVKALQSNTNGEQTQKVAKAAYDKGYEKAKAHFEEKYKDYVSPTKGRPTLDNSAPSKKDDSILEDDDIQNWGLSI